MAAPRPTLPSTGDLVAGRYWLRRKLAAGGMGAVYEADDQRQGGRVALKVLHPELAADREIHRRFRREASILAALDHPAVVRVLDVGTDDEGRSYTTMELLLGETLHARIGREPRLTPAALAPVVRDLCAGLKAAHDHGVIHGDVKPANLFLVASDSRTCVKIVDFGLSKVLGLERLTRTGEIIGTPIYMAPELLTGAGDIDERVDIYAVGVMIYEALCRKPPFRERNPGRLLYEIVSGAAIPLAEERPDLSDDVVAVVAQAMAPDRKRRFASADALCRAFLSVASG